MKTQGMRIGGSESKGTAKLALTVAVAVSVGAVALIANPGNARADSECNGADGVCGTPEQSGGGSGCGGCGTILVGGCGCGSSGRLIW